MYVSACWLGAGERRDEDLCKICYDNATWRHEEDQCNTNGRMQSATRRWIARQANRVLEPTWGLQMFWEFADDFLAIAQRFLLTLFCLRELCAKGCGVRRSSKDQSVWAQGVWPLNDQMQGPQTAGLGIRATTRRPVLTVASIPCAILMSAEHVLGEHVSILPKCQIIVKVARSSFGSMERSMARWCQRREGSRPMKKGERSGAVRAVDHHGYGLIVLTRLSVNGP